jgi:hypothetical protein
MTVGKLSLKGNEMAKKRAEAASDKKMSLEQRIANYRADGRRELTPRQLRRAAHKAGVSTAEVRQKAVKA